jgi:hypothetical protein
LRAKESLKVIRKPQTANKNKGDSDGLGIASSVSGVRPPMNLSNRHKLTLKNLRPSVGKKVAQGT